MSDQFKLFGRRIAVPEAPVAEEAGDALESPKLAVSADPEKDPCQETISAEVKDLVLDATEGLDCNDVEGASGIDITKDPSDKETSADDELMVELKPEKGHKLAGQEKVKKPDKILPCPRCSSMDTKFCYYNNYNVNQPRHFCKNCQRYWTVGGTMRNVPVGAGRRKNKHSSASYRHIMTVTEGMPLSQVDGPESPQCHSTWQFNANRMVLKFGQEAQICDSITNSLNLTEQKRQDDVSTTLCGENVKGSTSSSFLPSSNSLEKGTLENAAHVKQSALPDSCSGLIPMCPPQCYPSTPWAFHWSSNWNDAATASGKSVSAVTNVHETGNLNPIAWPLPPMMAPSSFVGPTVPISFIPTSFWGCMASWPAGSWSTPSIGPTGSPVPSPSSENGECLGIHSPRLGKHSRDSIQQVEEKVEKSLWVPKTLRIDDPEEAAKSSIWATLGIKHVQNEAHVKSGIFKSFQPDTNARSLQPDTHVMHANPAAFSRSQTFQESS